MVTGNLNLVGALVTWGLMFCFVEFGWFLFRAPSLEWLMNALSNVSMATSVDQLSVAFFFLLTVVVYCIPLLFLFVLELFDVKFTIFEPAYLAVIACLVILFHSTNSGDFI